MLIGFNWVNTHYKDTIWNDPKRYWVRTQKGPNNIICRAWVWKARPWSLDGGWSWCTYSIKSCSLEESFSWRRAGRLSFLAIFPSHLLWIAYFSVYISLYPLSNVHMWIRLSRTDTCPISSYPEWLGVVVKAEEYGPVKCRMLNGSNGSFPFVLSRYSIQRLPFYWPRYFRSFPNCSHIVFALSSRRTSDMPRTESSSTVSQDYFVLVLPILDYNLPQLEPWAPTNKWARATNYWAPQKTIIKNFVNLNLTQDTHLF